MGKQAVSAVVAAAGASSRMDLKCGGSKQLIEIAGKPVVARTLEIFNASPYICEIVVSARGCDIDRIREIAGAFSKVKSITEGGGTRFESVAGAVRRVSHESDYVAVHDGARCFVTLGDIEKVALCAFSTGAAAAGCRVTDTLKRVDAGGRIEQTLERGNLWAVQTPQIFLKDWYLRALELFCLPAGASPPPDDCYIMESAGYSVTVVECSKYNLKLTDRQDLEFFERIT